MPTDALDPEADRALCEAATDGPWWTNAKYSADELGCALIAARTDAGPLPGNPTRGMVAWVSEVLPENAQQCEANAAFIAAARTLLPRYIDAYAAQAAEIERLAGENGNLREMQRQTREWRDQATAECDAALARVAAMQDAASRARALIASGSGECLPEPARTWTLEAIDAALATPSPDVAAAERAGPVTGYRCPICGTADRQGYLRCNWPDCPDGRDEALRAASAGREG